jgi:hypothetical protein
MVLARDYLNKLLANKAVAIDLQHRQPELLQEFRAIISATSLDEAGGVAKLA